MVPRAVELLASDVDRLDRFVSALHAFRLEIAGVVYARIVQEEVVYIRSVDQRLCDRIQEHLRIILTPRYAEYRKWVEGKRITTVAYKPPLIEVLGRLIPVHRALEAALIAEFHPRFVAQTGSVRPDKLAGAMRRTPPSSTIVATTKVTLDEVEKIML